MKRTKIKGGYVQEGKKEIERESEILQRMLPVDQKFSFSSCFAHKMRHEISFLIRLMIWLEFKTEFRKVARFLVCQIQNKTVAIK